MMNKKEKEAVRLIAMEAYEILDDINCNAVFLDNKKRQQRKGCRDNRRDDIRKAPASASTHREGAR